MTGSLHSRLGRAAGALTVLIAAVTLSLGVPGGRLAAHPATAAPAFDWSVPNRFNADGMIGVSYPMTESPTTMSLLNPEKAFADIAPRGWPADFDACASQGGTRYLWKVNGALVKDTTTCSTRLTFPREGLYLVELTLVDTFGGQTSIAKNVNIQDWLIFGLGDSYASGEGNPNVPVTLEQITSLETARLVLEAAEDNVANAMADMAAAKANVDAAKADRAAAIADYNALLAASLAFANATADLAAKQLAATQATAAQTAARAAVVAAAAKVVFECAQWWDPAGCTAAQKAYTKAVQAEAAATAKRNTAIAQRDAAAQLLAQLTLAVPAEGFSYLLGVASAQVDVLTARVSQLETAWHTAVDFVDSTRELAAAARVAMDQKAESLATWQDSKLIPNNGVPFNYSQCHQSKFSGQALAALKIEEADPKTSVTFIHLACTGAKILNQSGEADGGLLDSYDGVSPRPDGIADREPQLTVAGRMSSGREVDALVTSIGGNDIGFGKILKGCIVLNPCFATANSVMPDAEIDDVCNAIGADLRMGLVPAAICKQYLKSAREELANVNIPAMLDAKLAVLPTMYVMVQQSIQTKWPGLPADRMFLTEYPMLTRDHLNQVCGFDVDPLHSPPGVSQAEFTWAEREAADRLNQIIAAQKTALGWTTVTGIAEASRLKGYCSADTWVVGLGQALATQASKMGTAHPTKVGHQLGYVQQIFTALEQKFYPQGVARVDGRQ